MAPCALVVLFASAVGCAAPADEAEEGSSESGVTLASHVVVAEQSATAAAEVEAERILLPAAVAQPYRTLAPGTIFVGARGSATGKNPDGFLRRVVDVGSEGDRVVVRTAPAKLTDAIVEGTVRASNGSRTFDDHGSDEQTSTQSLHPLTQGTKLSGIEIDFSNRTLFENEDVIEGAGGAARFIETIRTNKAVLSARPVVDVDVRIRDGRVSRFVAKVEGNLDASIEAVAKVTAAGEVDDAALTALRGKKHTIEKVLYRSKRVALPTFAIGRVPVSPSIQFTVSLACDVSFGGALEATAGVEAKSYVRMGGVYEHGRWGDPIQSTFDIRPSFALAQSGEVHARCAVEASAELLAYGTSGVAMTVGPYVDVDVAAAKPHSFGAPPGADPFVYRMQAGATGSIQGRSDVFGVPPAELDRTLVEWRAPMALSGSSR